MSGRLWAETAKVWDACADKAREVEQALLKLEKSMSADDDDAVWHMEKAHELSEATERAEEVERERCARLVESFPDSLWRHSFRKRLVAQIRSGK